MEKMTTEEEADMKYKFEELYDHTRMLREMLDGKENQEYTHQEMMVFIDFSMGIFELQWGIVTFLDDFIKSPLTYQMKNIFKKQLPLYMNPGIEKLERFETQHRGSPETLIIVEEISATLHSILYQAKQLLEKY